MNIINFEEAKKRKILKANTMKHTNETDEKINLDEPLIKEKIDQEFVRKMKESIREAAYYGKRHNGM